MKLLIEPVKVLNEPVVTNKLVSTVFKACDAVIAYEADIIPRIPLPSPTKALAVIVALELILPDAVILPLASILVLTTNPLLGDMDAETLPDAI